jgi:hypothetical protein
MNYDSPLSAAAVANAWGISNRHGFRLNYNFFPVRHYASILLERNCSRAPLIIGGTHFLTVMPATAIHGVFHHYINTYLQKQRENFTLNCMRDRKV